MPPFTQIRSLLEEALRAADTVERLDGSDGAVRKALVMSALTRLAVLESGRYDPDQFLTLATRLFGTVRELGLHDRVSWE